MPDNENKKTKGGTSRYPLNSREQAKRTLSRLIRDVLNNRIDVERYRAGVYGINTLIQIFKIESPVSFAVASGQLDVTLISREERERRINELLGKRRIESGQEERAEEAISIPVYVPPAEPEPEPEPAEATARLEDTGAAWQPCGIGARRTT
jgi:hypothetical protein